ncbi:MAG: YbhB/YbcL family Raf kinase inhibitor-like protein [Kofleriaceae bacterium]
MTRITANNRGLGSLVESFVLESSTVSKDGAFPVRVTADGEGISPALTWTDLPDRAVTLALIVEDADSPTPIPLVHALVANLTRQGALGEGDMNQRGDDLVIGRNSFFKQGWLPPDPPRGHGPHRYAFQAFALDKILDLAPRFGRSSLIDAMKGHILGRSMLVATYERA